MVCGSQSLPIVTFDVGAWPTSLLGGRMQDNYGQVSSDRQDALIQSASANSSDKPVRNRKRSKRRAIYCPIHGCYMDSVSQKYSMYAETADQLQESGVGRRAALLLMATQTTVSLTGEWLEAFWCEGCQQKEWYHVKRVGNTAYAVKPAPAELWHQVQGVIHPHGNPSVGEFTRKASKMSGYQGMRQFSFVG
jgi:hypothetical protein